RIEFETERERLTSAMGQAVETATKLQGERERLHRDLNQAVQTGTQLESERTRLESERTRLESERSKLTSEISRLREEAQVEILRAHKAAEAAAEAKLNAELTAPPEIDTEVGRIESKIREISALIEDPATELSVVIRKNVERSELDSYLKGI